MIIKTYKTRRSYSLKKPSIITLLILFSCGLSLIIIEYSKIENYVRTKKNPVVTGIIVSSMLVESNRNFIPKVEYTYVASKDTFLTSEILYSPSFGTKETRKKSTLSILKKYRVGTRVPVYYNEQNPKEATIDVFLSWDVFIRLGSGILLWCLFSFSISDLAVLRILSKIFK